MNKRNWICATALLGIMAGTGPAGAASSAPATQPASAMPPAAATVAHPATVAHEQTVLLLPFDAVGTADMDWIAKAVQKDLLAELSRAHAIQPILPQAAPSEEVTPEQALALGRQAGATYVIFGSYQILNQELRITGQVLDVRTGEYQGSLKATGAMRDLFALEDDLARQARQILPQPPRMAQANPPAPAAPPAPPAVQPPNPPQPGNVYEGSDLQQAVQSGQLGVTPPPMYYDSNDYNRNYWYTYSTPSYGYPYGYPYFFSRPIIVINPPFRHFHHRSFSCIVTRPDFSPHASPGRGQSHWQGHASTIVRSAPARPMPSLPSVSAARTVSGPVACPR
jgi:TolB-like protein